MKNIKLGSPHFTEGGGGSQKLCPQSTFFNPYLIRFFFFFFFALNINVDFFIIINNETSLHNFVLFRLSK